jgi:hypothetical protein
MDPDDLRRRVTVSAIAGIVSLLVVMESTAQCTLHFKKVPQYSVVTGRHVTRASAETKMKTCLDLFLFLAGLPHSPALSKFRNN